MRFFLKIDIEGNEIRQNELHYEYLNKYLPIEDVVKNIKGIYLKILKYKVRKAGIIEKNWEKPYFNNDEYFIFIAGYVLNRIKESDRTNIIVPKPEQILNIILKTKDNHYNYLKGCYYILLFEKTTKKITIYSSPMYLYPVFYTLKNNVLVFSNVLSYIINDLDKKEINEQGIIEFSLFDHTIGFKTIYKNLYTITGGKKIELKKNFLKESIVYDISRWIHSNPRSKKESLENINYILKKVIYNYVSNVEKFNISLTGGFDGRLNFSMIHPKDYQKLQAFSYGKIGSLQISIPEKISRTLGFRYIPVKLDKDFENQYSALGYETILLSGGITPFIRANYLYSYNKISDYSRNCLIGQCDMIRPLYNNPAGAIFNEFTNSIFLYENYDKFLENYKILKNNGYVNKILFNKKWEKVIYDEIVSYFVDDYYGLSNKERLFLFLYKESMIKFWQTECHVVDLFVDDFIPFSDLDFIEELASSQYFGLYKGIFAKNQFQRRKAHDLYIDLMDMNNRLLNNIITDRFFKPKWLKYGILGYLIAFIGKQKSRRYYNRVGNDTFGEESWTKLFYNSYSKLLNKKNSLFSNNLSKRNVYKDDNAYRFDRHISLKLWLDYIGIS